MAAGDHDRHASRNVRQTEINQYIPFIIRQKKLFRVICEDTDPIDPLINHAVEHTPLPVQV
jgi:hypothetical protein